MSDLGSWIVMAMTDVVLGDMMFFVVQKSTTLAADLMNMTGAVDSEKFPVIQTIVVMAIASNTRVLAHLHIDLVIRTATPMLKDVMNHHLDRPKDMCTRTTMATTLTALVQAQVLKRRLMLAATIHLNQGLRSGMQIEVYSPPERI
jgi:hypothetical protein